MQPTARNPLETPRTPHTEAAPNPSGSGRRFDPSWMRPIVETWLRDAETPGAGEVRGDLLALAGEAVEFALRDPAAAADLYRDAIRSLVSDTRAWSGLRRQARRAGDVEALESAWELQMENASPDRDRAIAGLGLAGLLLRDPGSREDALNLLDHVEGFVSRCPASFMDLHCSMREDALVSLGRDAEARRVRGERVARRMQGVDGSDTARLLESFAALCEAGGDADGASDWYAVALEAGAGEAAARAVLREAFRGDAAAALGWLDEVVSRTRDPGLRAVRSWSALARRLDAGVDTSSAMQRAWALRDEPTCRAAALCVISENDAYLRGLESTHRDLVDFGMIETSTTPIERAMFGVETSARRLAEGRPGEALELARAAWDAAPCADVRENLKRVLRAVEAWDELATVIEEEADAAEDATLVSRLRLDAARLHLERTGDLDRAEELVARVLEDAPCDDALRLQVRILERTGRHEELVDALFAVADGTSSPRERLAALRRAAAVAEHRIADVARAIEAWRAVLVLEPEAVDATDGLIRLLSESRAWEEVVDALVRDARTLRHDVEGRRSRLRAAARIAVEQLLDDELGESLYREILAAHPEDGEASDALIAMLERQTRWSECADLLEATAWVASGSPAQGALWLRLARVRWECLRDGAGASEALERARALGAASDPWILARLDRIASESGDAATRLDVLLARYRCAQDEGERARLAWRLSRLLESRPEASIDAFLYAIEGMSAEGCTAAAMSTLERLWDREGIDDVMRAEALQALRLVAARGGVLRRGAATLMVTRGDGILPAADLQRWTATLAAEYPDDVALVERAAIRLLRMGDVEGAVRLRGEASPTRTDRARYLWSALEDGVPLDPSDPGVRAIGGDLADVLAHELGHPVSGMPGASERGLFLDIGTGRLGAADAARETGTEAAHRVALVASLALGDEGGVRDARQELFGREQNATRRMRLALDAAQDSALPRREVVSWLRLAHSCAVWEPSLRRELYAAMTQAGDAEGLADAIAAHLEQSPDEEDAARMSRERANCLNLLGRWNDALDALRLSTVLRPAQYEYAVEKARLERQLGRLDDARNTLEDCLDAGCAGPGRVEILTQLGDLHRMEGGDVSRSISALEDAWVLSSGSREIAFRLASLHGSDGDPLRAAELLEENLGRPVRKADTPYWQLLARLCANVPALSSRAEPVLWEMFDAFPNDPAWLTQLEDWYRRAGGAATLVDRLSARLAEGRLDVDEARAAELWRYVGDVNLSVLRRPVQAQHAYAAARGRTGTDGTLMLAEARALAAQPGRERETVRMTLQAAGSMAIEADAWRELAGLLDRSWTAIGDSSRLRFIRQLRTLLGERVELLEDRARREPTRELEDALTWRLLGEQAIELADVRVLQAAAPLADRVLPKLATRRALGDRRPRAEEFTAFGEHFDAARTWLGAAAPRLTWVDADGGVEIAESAHFVVPARTVGNDRSSAARFWAGWTAAMSFTGVGVFSRVEDGLTLDLLRSVAARSRSWSGAERPALYDEVGGLLVSSLRRATSDALREHPGILEREAPWARGVLGVADRAGLLMSGDLILSVEEILRSEDWRAGIGDPRTLRRVLGSARVMSLVRWSLGDACAQCRYESGLAARPVLLDERRASGAWLSVG